MYIVSSLLFFALYLGPFLHYGFLDGSLGVKARQNQMKHAQEEVTHMGHDAG